jgi:hypothetical protein
VLDVLPAPVGNCQNSQYLAEANEKGTTVTPSADEAVSFETHIKPMFRERDQQSMQRAFDLWSHDDVSRHADAILARLQAGTMPCDGAWPEAQVDLFRRRAEGGKPS